MAYQSYLGYICMYKLVSLDIHSLALTRSLIASLTVIGGSGGTLVAILICTYTDDWVQNLACGKVHIVDWSWESMLR